MKTLTLCYRKYGKEILLDTLKEAINGKECKVEEDIIYFNDLGAMYKFLSPARAELLSIIRKEQPKSIYALAQKMQKDQGYISKEIKFLHQLGILDLIADESGSRQKLIPVVKFDRVVFDVGLDEVVLAKAASE
jgi:predicted transcriptional regulator